MFTCEFTLQALTGTLCGVQVTSISRLGISGTVGDVGVIVNTPQGIVSQPVVPRPTYLIADTEISFFMNDTVPGAVSSWPTDDLEIAQVGINNLPILFWNATCWNGTTIFENSSSAYVFDIQSQYHTIQLYTSAAGGGCLVTAAASRFGVPTSSNYVFIGIATGKPTLDASNSLQYLRGLQQSTFSIRGNFLPRRMVDPGDGLGIIQDDFDLSLVWRTHPLAAGACSVNGQSFADCAGVNLTLPTVGNEILCSSYLNTNDSNCGLFATVRRGPLTSDETQIGLLQYIAPPVAPPVASPALPPQQSPVSVPVALPVPTQPPQLAPANPPVTPPLPPPPVTPAPTIPPIAPPPVNPPSQQPVSQAYVRLLLDALAEPTNATLRLIQVEIASALELNANVDINVFSTFEISKKRAQEAIFGLIVDFLTPLALKAFSDKVIATPEPQRLAIFNSAVAGATGSTISVASVFVAVPPSWSPPQLAPAASAGPLASDLPPGFLNSANGALGVGPIIGIVIAAIAVIALVVFVIIFVKARRRQREIETVAQELKEIEREVDDDDEELDESDIDSDELTSGSSYSYESSSWDSNEKESSKEESAEASESASASDSAESSSAASSNSESS
jgi:Sec-independent protein translocase protein TatA